MPLNYNEIAKHYSQHRKIHPGVLGKLLEVGKLGADNTVLEIGCGTGNYILDIQAVSHYLLVWGVKTQV